LLPKFKTIKMIKPKKLSNKSLSWIISDTLDKASNLLHFTPNYNHPEFSNDFWPFLTPTEFSIFRNYFDSSKKEEHQSILFIDNKIRDNLIREGKFEAYIPISYQEFSSFVDEVSKRFRGDSHSAFFHIQRGKRFYRGYFPQQSFNGEIFLELTKIKESEVIGYNFFKVSKR